MRRLFIPLHNSWLNKIVGAHFLEYKQNYWVLLALPNSTRRAWLKSKSFEHIHRWTAMFSFRIEFNKFVHCGEMSMNEIDGRKSINLRGSRSGSFDFHLLCVNCCAGMVFHDPYPTIFLDNEQFIITNLTDDYKAIGIRQDQLNYVIGSVLFRNRIDSLTSSTESVWI